MEEKKTSAAYKVLRFLIRLFYQKTRVVGAERLPDEPCILVGNHAQMNGPLVAELYLPCRREIWCAGAMMRRREVAAYAFQDFWSAKPRWTLPFYRLLSHLIVPLALCLFNNAHTIPVDHDARLRATLRLSLEALERGENLVIFPECYGEHNHIVHDFQDRFIDLARLYYRRTGKALCFVPLYIAPALREAHIGAPLRCDPAAPFDQERARLKNALMDAITDLALSLPRHRVVPYPNVPRREYPYNKP